jgi:spore maturation protein CgeB
VKIAIAGAFTGTHLGGSFTRAAAALGLSTLKLDVHQAESVNPYLRSLLWRVADKRPLWMGSFGRHVIAACTEENPEILIATGAASLTKRTLHQLRSRGIICINFSADDPWNPALRARWHLRALPEYDFIFSPRRATLDDFRRLGCDKAQYLPFAFDELLSPISNHIANALTHEVLFVGGADRDRVTFMTEFIPTGPPVALVGGYWDRFPATRRYALGIKSPKEVQALTATAKINLCLVRRANRDGHVMRSFEIAANGGCLLAEDTQEHREIFGEDEMCAVYFRTPQEAAARAHALIADPGKRRRLAISARKRIATGHSYRDRLLSMLRVAGKVSLSPKAAAQC